MCVTPYITTDRHGAVVAVPCGKCIQCLRDFQNQWSFRLSQECKRSVLPLFITLTYNDAHLPIGEDEKGRIHSVLVKKDLQNFIKRFRRYNPQLSKSCRYFAIGEYGSKKNRCHYHLVLILPELRWTDFRRKSLLLHYLKKRVDHAWTLDHQQIGYTKVKPCEDGQITYITKYMNKLDKRPHLVKPFRLMSKSIGLNFLTDAMVNYYLSTFDRTVSNGNCKINIPKYYRQKLDEYSHKHWMLKRAGLTYSDLLPKPQHYQDSLRGIVAEIQRDFCDNFDSYYRRCVAHIAHMSCVHGYQFYEPNRNEVYQFVVDTNKVLQDAIRISNEKLDSVCIKNSLIGYHEITPEQIEYG